MVYPQNAAQGLKPEPSSTRLNHIKQHSTIFNHLQPHSTTLNCIHLFAESNLIVHSISRMIDSVMGSFKASGNTSQV